MDLNSLARVHRRGRHHRGQARVAEDARDPAAVALGRKGGLKGGRARVAAEGLHRAPLVDTYRVHTVDVGTVTVRTGVLHEEPAELRVVVEQIEDVDGTADSTEPRIRVCPPAGWSEDYTADEAERLARCCCGLAGSRGTA